jgi:hypothetical protein
MTPMLVMRKITQCKLALLCIRVKNTCPIFQRDY